MTLAPPLVYFFFLLPSRPRFGQRRSSIEQTHEAHLLAQNDMQGDACEYGGCDRFIGVGRTRLTDQDNQRLRMLGAFAQRDFSQFEFIGFYTGEFLVFDDGKGPRATSNQYTYGVDDVTWIRPSRRMLNNHMHPIARVNDPPFGTEANCAFVVYYNPADVLPERRRRGRKGVVAVSSRCLLSLLAPPCLLPLALVACSLSCLLPLRTPQVALHAARVILRGEELYAHYGSTFARDYVPGKPAHVRKSDIPSTCRPSRSAAASVCALSGPTQAVALV